MEFYREMLDGKKLTPILDLPESIAHSQVEVIVLPISAAEPAAIEENTTSKDMMGALKRYRNPAWHEIERQAFSMEMGGKYDYLKC